MNNTNLTVATGCAADAPRPAPTYATPQLTSYGSISALTASGSGGTSELAPGGGNSQAAKKIRG